MAQVTVCSGTEEITRNFSDATVKGILADAGVQSMGFGDNVEVKRNGITLSEFANLNDGDTVVISQKSNGKAA